MRDALIQAKAVMEPKKLIDDMQGAALGPADEPLTPLSAEDWRKRVGLKD